ncbi:hypothetical protein AB0H82_22260 [Streptomyces sp. NPDC050732]|uniref:hypothetical protein n=1 Tax=Streptomyces sp. NPDC050732 TaxID=3154632 RepID=UPI0034147262
MPRPTTTAAAAILVSVAVSAAVSGCVSVEQPPEPAPSAVTGPPPAARTDGTNRPHLVQAPAREALQRMGPPRRPSPRQTEAGTQRPGPPHSHDRPTPAAPPPPPAAPVRKPAPARPDARAPRPAPPKAPAAGRGTDVCALGEAYGNWDPDSPQAVICRNTYGR